VADRGAGRKKAGEGRRGVGREREAREG